MSDSGSHIEELPVKLTSYINFGELSLSSEFPEGEDITLGDNTKARKVTSRLNQSSEIHKEEIIIPEPIKDDSTPIEVYKLSHNLRSPSGGIFVPARSNDKVKSGIDTILTTFKFLKPN